jgi:hypothetical protein
MRISGLSRAYTVTGDKATQAKVQRLVAGFAPTISKKFYKDYCIPAYTFDKPTAATSTRISSPTIRNPSPSSTAPPTPSFPSSPPRHSTAPRWLRGPHKNISFTWDETYTLPENFYLLLET